MLSQAVKELEKKLLKLDNISYNSIDRLMRKIMKSHNLTALELHNGFKNKYKKTPDDWIKEKMKNLKEDHKEIASGKKSDDEGYMARNELDSIERAIKNLRKSIKSGKQQLPAWVQSKITRAADYIDTASEYLESDEKIDEGKEVSFAVKKSSGAGALTPDAAKQLGPKAIELQKKKAAAVSLPTIKKEEISLVEKILGEEKCGKGMYWCNTDKVCKPLPEGMKVPGQKIKPTEVGIGKPVEGSCTHTKKGKSCPVHGMNECPMSEEKDPKGPTQAYKSPQELAKKHGVSLKHIQKQVEMGTKVESEHTSDKKLARITALQHLDELPDYYTKLKKMETQKESSIVRDANGNYYAEFIDIIKSGTIEEENPCWKGYTQVGMKMKNGKEVPNCVPSKGVPKAKGYKKNNVNEAARIPAQTGNNVFVTLSWRGKYYGIQIFFPQAKVPSRIEVSDEIQKIYPGSTVITYRVAEFKQGEPLLYAYRGGSPGKIGPNKNYVKPMGEEVELDEAGDWWHPDPKKDRAISGVGNKMRSREDRGENTSTQTKPDYSNRLKPGETYMQFAKRKAAEKKVKEEVEISEAKKSEMPCNKPKAQAHGSGETGKSHVVKACEGGKEKLIRFGQLGVKGSPKKKGESEEYANRRKRFKARHSKNIKKGKMSAAYWANKVKW